MEYELLCFVIIKTSYYRWKIVNNFKIIENAKIFVNLNFASDENAFFAIFSKSKHFRAYVAL